MKLTGELKKKVDAAESRDEAKRAIADAGMELTDDELEQVAGGGSGRPQWRGPKFEIGQRVRVRWGPVAEKVGTVMSVQSKKFWEHGNLHIFCETVRETVRP